jgi:hypothetical protein
MENKNHNSPIRGRVIIRKTDGTIILDKDNMVVQTGRKFLRELFINSLVEKSSVLYSDGGIIEEPVDALTLTGGSGTVYTRQFNGYFVNQIGFGDSGTATEFTRTDLYGTNKLYFNLSNEKIIFPPESTELFLVFTAEINNTSALTGFLVEELGLFITRTEKVPDGPNPVVPGENNIFTRTMFSRIPFDPIPISSGDRYELEYYLYF